MWSFICRSQIMRMISTQIQLHSRKKDDAGRPWVRLHFRNMKMLLITCSYTQIQGFFVKVLITSWYSTVSSNQSEQLLWISMTLTFSCSAQRRHLEPGERNCSQPPCGKVTKPSMYVVFYLQTKNHEIDFDTRFLGKGQCWATMSATSLQKHQNAATTLLESGSIWPDSVRLQDVILTPTCLRCFHVSHHEKCAKANLPMLLSLSPCKLKRTNCHSWVMEQSGLIVEQLSSRRNASLWQFLHVFHEPTSSPAIQTFSVTLAICGWNPSQSDHFEPSVLPPYGKMWSVPNMYAIFCWQNNDENDFDSNSVARQEKRQCWCPMSGTSLQTMRKAVPKSPDSDTWRVERVLGSIWRSIVTLQNVRLTVTSPLLQYH